MPDLNPDNAWTDFSHRLQAEHAPITPENQRCVERLQNSLIRKLRIQNAQLTDELRQIRARLDTLEVLLKQRPNWHINVPSFSAPLNFQSGARVIGLKTRTWDNGISAGISQHTCYDGCPCQSGNTPTEDFASYERDYRLPSLNEEDETC